jgi:hypothetical protein
MPISSAWRSCSEMKRIQSKIATLSEEFEMDQKRTVTVTLSNYNQYHSRTGIGAIITVPFDAVQRVAKFIHAVVSAPGAPPTDCKSYVFLNPDSDTARTHGNILYVCEATNEIARPFIESGEWPI